MGVYIKGMEMPKGCAFCRIGKRNWKKMVCPLCDEEWDIHDPMSADHRLDNCPLATVPPHERLIDADALADIFRSFIAMYDSCPFSQLSFPDKARRDELQSALAEVINAPTIIEAEEGE